MIRPQWYAMCILALLLPRVTILQGGCGRHPVHAVDFGRTTRCFFVLGHYRIYRSTSRHMSTPLEKCLAPLEFDLARQNICSEFDVALQDDINFVIKNAIRFLALPKSKHFSYITLLWHGTLARSSWIHPNRRNRASYQTYPWQPYTRNGDQQNLWLLCRNTFVPKEYIPSCSVCVFLP